MAMVEVTAARVKELREKTGAGMMDCKRALTESGGDLEAAVDWLRTKGLAAASKKAGRVTAEGLVGIHVAGNAGAVIEVNSETDFVSRNQEFQTFVATAAGLALTSGGDLERLKEATYPLSGRTLADEIVHMIATIGENMALRRCAMLAVGEGVLGVYVHNQLAAGLGKIGVLVALESAGDRARLEPLAKQIAMHVAATNPQSISADDLDPALRARERAILIEQARESGKPEAIIEKMVEGRLRKYYEDVCLLDQTFVIDGESKVRQVLDAAAKELGTGVRITGFVRFALGEGIEKRDSDFAGEVAKAAGG
jgi:elongation factor Ts